MSKNILGKLTRQREGGFTIVELAAVIVIIVIISSISIIGYNSWEQSTVTAQLKSDLNGASSAMESARTFGNTYPETIPSTFKSSKGVTLAISSISGEKNYCIDASSSRDATVKLYIDSYLKSGGARTGTCATRAVCPTGFIVIEGSITYGTNDFCVMKYEAKESGGDIPVSKPDGSPWIGITQSQADNYSKNVANCNGCHLINEAEWMTIAQDILKNSKNWDDGSGNHDVNVGYVYTGHSDNDPGNALEVPVGTNDGNTTGYENTNNSLGDTSTRLNASNELVAGNTQRRIFYLMNGEIIWDISGNVKEWTSGIVTGGQPGITGAGLRWRNWSDITNPGSLSTDASPLGTGVTENGYADAASGIGGIFSSSEETEARSVIRGGCWDGSCWDGVLSVMFVGAGDSSSTVGFRVAAPLAY